MATLDGVHVHEKSPATSPVSSSPNDEKFENIAIENRSLTSSNEGLNELEKAIEVELNVTEKDLLEAKAIAKDMTLEHVRKEMMATALKIHERDPNFPHTVLMRIHEFVENTDVIEHPERHQDLIWQMKLEAALITNNSPYAEVRSVVDNKDDPSTPCSTVRAWTIGIFFSIFLAFINQLFSVRQPPISIDSNVAQLLAYPLGKMWEKSVPDYHFKLFGTEHSLNPGPFNKKEHMLISIMANVAKSLPYTQSIVWTQVLPQYFNQQYARSFGYQLLIGMSTNFIGYGLAGIMRKFLVYPSYCMWPHSLVIIALNSALHNETNLPVPGPLKKIFRMSRYRFFFISFAAMFIYFWFPNYLFECLTYFSWMTWIAPENHTLEILTGFRNGLGLFNPWPTFDWNVLLTTTDPLMVPFFSTVNFAVGGFFFGFVIMAVYFTNTWNTGYLPIISNRVYDHYGHLYNVSRVLDKHGIYDEQRYMEYSAAYLGAANTIIYGAFFGVYAAAITYVALFHRHEIMMGFRSLWSAVRRKPVEGSEEGEYKDVHNRLMAAYPEVSEWWYFAVLIVAAGFGFAGIAGWPTFTNLGVVPFGAALALIFIIPIGVIKAMTGFEITLNVLAEFIGGIWSHGNALEMNFFKSFGYVTAAHAIHFTADLKLAHYLKIPPRHTFAAQCVATFIATMVGTGVMQYQINIPRVCQADAPMRFLCPGPNTFFTASVLWGTIGPIKVFGPQGQYGALLLGFPLGAISVIIFYFIVRRFPKNRALRQIHPVALWFGGIGWAPYSYSYALPTVPVAWLSWIYIKNRYLAFWSKYNFVLSASFSAGIAISAIVMFFTVSWAEVTLDWWGNSQPYIGCEGSVPCTMLSLAKGERFFPWWHGNGIPAP